MQEACKLSGIWLSTTLKMSVVVHLATVTGINKMTSLVSKVNKVDKVRGAATLRVQLQVRVARSEFQRDRSPFSRHCLTKCSTNSTASLIGSDPPEWRAHTRHRSLSRNTCFLFTSTPLFFDFPEPFASDNTSHCDWHCMSFHALASGL